MARPRHRLSLARTAAALSLIAASMLGAKPSDAASVRQVLVGTGGDTETSITVGRDGSMLVCSHGGFDSASPVWASLNGGRTWRRADPSPNPIVSGDCDMTILDDGTWAVVFDTIASATVAVSHDRGKSWTVSYMTVPPFGGVDRPWIAAVGKTLLLFYGDVQSTEPAIHFLARSTDDGQTWTDVQVLNAFEVPDRVNGIMGRPLVEGRTIRVPIMMGNIQLGGPKWLYLLTSRDGGDTWKRTDVAGPYPSVAHFPTVTRAGNGTLYMGLVTGDTPMDNGASVLVSDNDGRTWKNIALDEDVAFDVVGSVSVDARPDGSATAVWLAVTPNGRQVWAARVNAKGVLIRARPISRPVISGGTYEFIMVDHDKAGHAHVVAPLETGSNCHRPTVMGRGIQCVYDFVER